VSDSEAVVVATHVKPATGYGGVAESVFNLCAAWTKMGRRILLCASDGSNSGRLRAADIGLPAVILYRAPLFKRWGFGPAALWRIPAACRRAPRVYVCGIATWPTTLAALFCSLTRRPFAVAPRGGLMERPIAIIRAEKPLKWLYYRWLTLPSLRAAAFLHVTSEIERRGVEALLPGVRCVVVPNGLDLAAWQCGPDRRQDSLTLCYVGRLSREKGINRFLEIWLADHQNGETLITVGDGGGDYAERFRRLAGGAEGAVESLGYQTRAGVAGVLQRCDFLVLPSGLEEGDIRENFGNVVAEALAAGRPVLVMRGLAWDMAEEKGFGILVEPNEDGIRAALARARGLSAEDYAAMCAAARAYAEKVLDLQSSSAALWAEFGRLGNIIR
jgi:glycosyltransferase involved in cell wall biosynthesis